MLYFSTETRHAVERVERSLLLYMGVVLAAGLLFLPFSFPILRMLLGMLERIPRVESLAQVLCAWLALSLLWAFLFSFFGSLLTLCALCDLKEEEYPLRNASSRVLSMLVLGVCAASFLTAVVAALGFRSYFWQELLSLGLSTEVATSLCFAAVAVALLGSFVLGLCSLYYYSVRSREVGD